jgi:hypothetical protein
MTALNMAKHRDNPNMPFWRMIKEGNDHFEVTKAEPHVDVCDKHYVFDARAPANASTPLTFHPREKCPVYEIPESIWAAVKAKQANDERAFAEHVNRGVSTVAVKTGADGGMHPVFVAKLQGRGLFSLSSLTSGSSDVKAPAGPLPASVNPPRPPEQGATALMYTMQAPAMAAPSGQAQSGQAQSGQQAAQPGQSSSTMATIRNWLGWGGSETAAATPAAATTAQPAPKTKPAKPAAVANTPASKPKQTETAQAPSQAPSQAVH